MYFSMLGQKCFLCFDDDYVFHTAIMCFVMGFYFLHILLLFYVYMQQFYV